MKRSGPKKILIVLLHGLGDNIMATPAVRALKKKYPKSKITMMGLRTLPVKDIWEANPYVNGYITSSFKYNPRWWNPLAYFLFDHWKLLKEVKELKKDKGFDKVYIVKVLFDKLLKFHKSYRIAKELNVTLQDSHPDFFVTKTDEKEADKILKKYKLKKGKFICLHRVASDYDKKSWVMDQAQKFCNSTNDKILVFNSEKSYKIEGEKEGSHLKGKNVVNFTSKNLRVSGAILKRCKKFIGIDSIMAHIAGALNVKATILFIKTNPQKYGPLKGGNFEIIRIK